LLTFRFLHRSQDGFVGWTGAGGILGICACSSIREAQSVMRDPQSQSAIRNLFSKALEVIKSVSEGWKTLRY